MVMERIIPTNIEKDDTNAHCFCLETDRDRLCAGYCLGWIPKYYLNSTYGIICKMLVQHFADTEELTPQ